MIAIKPKYKEFFLISIFVLLQNLSTLSAETFINKSEDGILKIEIINSYINLYSDKISGLILID